MGKIRIHSRFGVVPNKLLNNENISLKAKGLYAYFQSKPDNWNFSLEGIASQSKEGIDAVRSALKELLTLGWILRKRITTSEGFADYDYTILDFPTLPNPTLENPTLDFPMHSNKDYSKKDNSKKEREGEAQKISEIPIERYPYEPSKSLSLSQPPPPSLDEVLYHFQQSGGTKKEAEKFYNYYSSLGWKKGGTAISNFRYLANTWIANDNTPKSAANEETPAQRRQRLLDEQKQRNSG